MNNEKEIKYTKGNIPIDKELLNKYSNVREMIAKEQRNIDNLIKLDSNINELKDIDIYKLTIEETKDLAIKIFNNHNSNKVFENKDNKIIVNNSGIRESVQKTFHNYSQKKFLKEHLLIFSELVNIIEHSELVAQSIENKGREKYNSWNYYFNNLKIDDKEFLLEIEIANMHNGENHFRMKRLELIENKKTVAQTGNTANSNITPAYELTVSKDNIT